MISLEEAPKAYDIGFADIFNVRIEGLACPLLQKKFDYWRSASLQPDLIISRGPLSDGTVAIDSDRFVGKDMYQVAYEGGAYQVSKDRLTCDGKVNDSYLEHYILMPVMNQRIVHEDRYLAYAAAVSHHGKVIALPGISGSGKTSLVLEFLSKGASYIGNNNIFIDRKGQCTLYSPYISFPERNARLYPELVPKLYASKKAERRGERRLSFHQMGMSMKGRDPISRAISRNLVSKSYFLEYAMFDQLFPGCLSVRAQKVDYAFLLERSNGSSQMLESNPKRMAELEATSDWIVDVGYHSALSEIVGLPHCEKGQVVDIMTDFFDNAECYEVQIPQNQTREGFRKLAAQIENIVG